MEELLEEYGIKYIFVGSCEREKYAELNEGLLQEMGSIVYSGMSSGTGAAQSYIIEVG